LKFEKKKQIINHFFISMKIKGRVKRRNAKKAAGGGDEGADEE
jgi:hypothetical protein